MKEGVTQGRRYQYGLYGHGHTSFVRNLLEWLNFAGSKVGLTSPHHFICCLFDKTAKMDRPNKTLLYLNKFKQHL